MATISKYQQQLGSALQSFYQKPVAKVSVELFLTIGLVMFLAIFAIRPTLVTMSDLIKEIDDKKLHDQKLEQKITALATAQSEYTSFEPRLPLLDQAISSKPKLVYGLKVLEKLATDNKVVIFGLTVSELPPEEPENSPFSERVLNTMPISINIIGDYISIRNFTEAIRNNRHAYIIESIAFTLNDESDDSKILRASITISVPYYAPQVKATAPTKATSNTETEEFETEE